jgi:hypothetical protein
MSIIARARSIASQRAQGQIQGVIGAAIPGPMGAVLSGAAVQAIARGPQALKAIVPTKEGLVDLAAGEITRRINGGGSNADALAGQASGRGATARPPRPTNGELRPVPTGSPPTLWTPAPLWGGMTLKRYREAWFDRAMTPSAWKNLFFVSIAELQPSREAPNGAEPINMLALDVAFSPVTMPGEAIALGTANLDKLEATERVEVRLTTLDDDRGTLKRWFIAKCDQAARTDGTVGLPAEYLCAVSVVHMDPTGKNAPDVRMTHRWLMRPSNLDIELSRRTPELEELPMSFVQFDTFMPAP